MPLLDIKPYFSEVDKVIVGADRITKDAVFNKIGTYTHAVLAKAHGIPFYVAAPISPPSTSNDQRRTARSRRGTRARSGGWARDSSPRPKSRSTTRPSAPCPWSS